MSSYKINHEITRACQKGLQPRQFENQLGEQIWQIFLHISLTQKKKKSKRKEKRH